MKKILGILVLGLIFLAETANAGVGRFKSGQFYEGEVVWSSRVKVTLPDGKWQVADKWNWSYNALAAGQVALILEENNIAQGIVVIGELAGNGKWISYGAEAVFEVLYTNKYDGCYERLEYFLVKNFKSGMSHNCFRVGHSDTQRNIYNSDDPFAKHYSAAIRKWLKDKNVKLPPIMLCSSHNYFAPVVRDTLYGVTYCMNPERIGGPKNKFFTEETSEYYPPNINNFPEHKKFMEKWVKLSAKRHRLFENGVRAKERHKLDFSEYGVEEVFEETQTTVTSSSTTEELKECVKLFKANELTKEQFENCKNKVLSQ